MPLKSVLHQIARALEHPHRTPRTPEAHDSTAEHSYPVPAEPLEVVRRSRRHPSPTQPDYLHLHHLVRDLERALLALDTRRHDVLDIFCGARPYDDLLPNAVVTGLDIDDPYGVADVVTDAFLPFDDEMFDLVMCTEAFHYVPDPSEAVKEISRVLRPDGRVVITVPFVWEYNPLILEHRFTEPELRALFREWADVEVVENGGRAVAWTTLTGHLLRAAEEHLIRRGLAPPLVKPLFSGAYLGLNAIGIALEAADTRYSRNPNRLPMNLMLTARRPHPST